MDYVQYYHLSSLNISELFRKCFGDFGAAVDIHRNNTETIPKDFRNLFCVNRQ